MKVLMLICALAVAVSVAFVACGPKEPYCKQSTTGQCFSDFPDAGPPPMDVAGPGDAIILGQD
jgi:hypothetical protein